MATSKKTTNAYEGYKGNQNWAQNTVPQTKKMTKVNGGTNAANQGLGYLNQLDTNLGGLYGNTAQIMIDNGATQAIEKARKNMQNMTNRQYNDNANAYYQMYKQNQNKLPENLSRLGINGGASETAALGLLNNYASNLYNNESARANALNEGNMKYNQMIADNSVQLSKQLADMYYNLGKGFLDERRGNQRADWEWNRNADYDNYTWNRNVGREDELNAYDRALAQAQYTGDFSVMKRYGWSDSDVSKANSLFAGNGTSGGSGGYGSYGGYGGYGGSSGSGSGSDTPNVAPSGYEVPNTTAYQPNPTYMTTVSPMKIAAQTKTNPYSDPYYDLVATDVDKNKNNNPYTKRYAYTR